MENRRLKTLDGGSGLSASLARLFAIVLLGAFLFGCSRASERPDGILSDREMVKVLMEIYINEEKVNRLSLRQDSALVVFSEFESRAFQKLGVTDSVFQKSLDYYFSRPQELHVIYSAVVDSLQLREQRVTSTKE
jgi:hypothetical protein